MPIQCNFELSALISKTLKLDKAVWLKDLTKLEGLLPFAEDKAFRKEWAAIKQRNKERLARHVQVTLGLTVNTSAMFDVQIKVGFSFGLLQILAECWRLLSVYMSIRFVLKP